MNSIMGWSCQISPVPIDLLVATKLVACRVQTDKYDQWFRQNHQMRDVWFQTSKIGPIDFYDLVHQNVTTILLLVRSIRFNRSLSISIRKKHHKQNTSYHTHIRSHQGGYYLIWECPGQSHCWFCSQPPYQSIQQSQKTHPLSSLLAGKTDLGLCHFALSFFSFLRQICTQTRIQGILSRCRQGNVGEMNAYTWNGLQGDQVWKCKQCICWAERSLHWSWDLVFLSSLLQCHPAE